MFFSFLAVSIFLIACIGVTLEAAKSGIIDAKTTHNRLKAPQRRSIHILASKKASSKMLFTINFTPKKDTRRLTGVQTMPRSTASRIKRLNICFLVAPTARYKPICFLRSFKFVVKAFIIPNDDATKRIATIIRTYTSDRDSSTFNAKASLKVNTQDDERVGISLNTPHISL